MKENVSTTVQEALGDFLGILEQKARSGELTHGDMEAMLSAIESAGGVKATVKDLAGYYGKSEDCVRHVIHRNIMPSPERTVYYDFASFRKRVPVTWRRRKSRD